MGTRGGYADYSSPFWVEISDFTTEIDLSLLGPNKDSGGRDLPRMLLIQSAGNIALQRADGQNIVTTGVFAGQELKVQPAKIRRAADGTTITRCTAFW